MYNAISNTAEYGGLKNGKRIITDKVKNEMEEIIKEIKDKKFFKIWELEAENDYPELKKMRKDQNNSLFESTAKDIISDRKDIY